MLELIFKGLIEWLYGLILEVWEYFFSVFTDILGVDFDYLKIHIPVIPEIMKILLAVGWALLAGNMVFQAAKSMMTGLGFEGEDPKQLFTRSFVFSFLLFASPQICEIGLSMTARIIALLDAVDAVDVNLIGEGAFGGLGAEWLLIIVINIILMFKVFRLLLEIVERYLVLAFLTMCAPLAFGMGGSKNTTDIFTGWCRMFASMCFVMVSNMLFFKLLLSLLGNVPTGLDVLVWIALVFGVVKVARKVDAIITRVGLNPALTGDGLGGHSLPGMLAYTVVRTMASNVLKSAGKSTGSSNANSTGGSGAKANGGKPNYKSAGTSAAGNSAGASASVKSGAGKGAVSTGHKGAGGGSPAQQSTAAHTTTIQTGAAQNGGQSWTPAGQPVDLSPNDSEAAAMDGTAPTPKINTQAQPSDTSGRTPDRKSSVPAGAIRSPSHVKQSGGTKVSGVSTSTVKSSASNSSRNTSASPGQAAPVSASAVSGGQASVGKSGVPNSGMAGAGTVHSVHMASSNMASGKGGTARPVTAGTGTASNVRMVSGNSGTVQSDTAGTTPATEPHTPTPSGKGVLPQPGLAGVTSAARDTAGASQAGTAGTGTVADTRKTSVDGATPKPGIAGTAAASGGRAATVRGTASRTGATGGAVPGGGKASQPGTAGTVAVSSENTVPGGRQASGSGTAGTGASRFTNAPRSVQNQTVQNTVQSEQQSAVTLEGAKQMPAGGVGKTPPATTGGTPSGGVDSRFTQRPAAAQPLQSGTGSRPGAAGTASAAQSTQAGPAAKESQRIGATGNGTPVPAAAQTSGTAPQEPRISHQSAASSGGQQSASRASARQETRSQAPKPTAGNTTAQQKPGDTRHSSVGDGEKRDASPTATAPQEHGVSLRDPASFRGIASIQHPGTAGTAPPAARPSRGAPADTRPPRPVETVPDVKEDTSATEVVPTEPEPKEDGGDE